jgi:hypothetical protein
MIMRRLCGDCGSACDGGTRCMPCEESVTRRRPATPWPEPPLQCASCRCRFNSLDSQSLCCDCSSWRIYHGEDAP